MDGESIINTVAHTVYVVLYCLLIIVSVLFYNWANLGISSCMGWITLIFGIFFYETLVESGMYALVRHPEFLSHTLIITALILIAQHWVSLLIGALLIVLLYLAMIGNKEMFGAAYKDYMKRVPRVDLLAGIVRQIHRKKEKI